MRDIVFGFSKSAKKFPIGSWLIRLYQNTPFSHTYVRIKPRIFKYDDIIHASEGKVLRMSGKQFDKRHTVVEEFSFQISDELYREVLNEMHEVSGDDYSIMQNIGILYVDIARILGFRVVNPFQTGWNCSEFELKVLKLIYPEDFKYLDPNTVTPKELYDILKIL